MIYDRFQNEAIEHINNNHSVIVSAPTGAGKTAIAEHVIETAIKNGTGVIYTAPIKALSNQKFRDFERCYGELIGVLTGDVAINADAPILIVTTEIFRNKILENPDRLKKYAWVIFDEIHYIDNPERGTVWEESLIFLPPHMNMLCLSATIPNIHQFAEWLESIHKKPIQVVIEDHRPVPLHFAFQCRNKIADKLEYYKNVRERRPNRLDTLVNHIWQKEGFPCIYFVFGRKRAEDLAVELYHYNFVSKEEQAEILDLFDSLCERFDLAGEKSAAKIRPLVARGIAFHHAGMLPTLKEVIERLFTSRLLKIIFTTETFALGINMPSRSVVIGELKKYYGRFIRALKTRDFYQMAGRAGRRGIDEEGFVYCKINLNNVDFNEVRGIIYNKPEMVKSQLSLSYATILNLYEKYRERLFDVYPLSFHYYQAPKHERAAALRAMEARLKLLTEWQYLEGGILTPKGLFAKNVYGYELILSELYSDGVFEELDEFSLGVIAAAVVFEPRRNQAFPHVPKAARSIKEACDGIYAEIRNKEQRYNIRPMSKIPYFHLSQAMWMWLQGTNFQKVREVTDTDEGELVRYFRMSVQVLREIRETPISEALKARVDTAIRRINRDVVDAEKQLREA